MADCFTSRSQNVKARLSHRRKYSVTKKFETKNREKILLSFRKLIAF